jgi:class 3 adenylate cyclase
MEIEKFSVVEKVANDCFNRVSGVVETKMAIRESVTKSISSGSVENVNQYSSLEYSYGRQTWATVLSVDMVKSSIKALKHGAKTTYIVMHTFLPVMAYLAQKKGWIIGFRGDGLFAGFGPLDQEDDSKFDNEQRSKSIYAAVNTGKAMVESCEGIINPLLRKNGIDWDCNIKVGVDCGDVIITRIGLDKINELTAYGHPVNKACKAVEQGVTVSKKIKDVYPVKSGGKYKFRVLRPDEYHVEFGGLKMLGM